jgi:hypothetical protein
MLDYRLRKTLTKRLGKQLLDRATCQCLRIDQRHRRAQLLVRKFGPICQVGRFHKLHRRRAGFCIADMDMRARGTRLGGVERRPSYLLGLHRQAWMSVVRFPVTAQVIITFSCMVVIGSDMDAVLVAGYGYWRAADCKVRRLPSK